ncbi:2-dehydropantoate 2-reductase [Amylibacter sp. SFDW26]|uniref:2-dehydropantoate 2-reductase n=1 Tax=Amylibacter sp. SFDW26 TaxID=2652722 RepID=UPI00126159BA|nr:2-dehydropantoate 2-reductase [Amylibacter sp. SFDW26]KAB7610284.1 2-dehydropantoate 2-reductase [Amylibacter sp. SFDW26]
MSGISKPVVMIGTGAIGCFTGCHWAASGMNIKLLGRSKSINDLKRDGLRFTGNTNLSVAPDAIQVTDDVRCLENAHAIILAIKSTALAQTIQDIRQYAPVGIPIVSLLNGLAPVRDLQKALPEFPIVAGMVPYNVAWKNTDHLHRSSAGNVALERCEFTEKLASFADETDAVVHLYDDLRPIQYGKLLLNLINPVNALSGMALHKQMSKRGYRLIYAAALEEALHIYKAAGVEYQKTGPFPPALIVRMLRLPDILFNHTALRLQKIDKATLTSMASDYQAHKPTEIATINGEIIHLASAIGLDAPVNKALIRLIETAQTKHWPRYDALELAQAIGLKA